jgi:hypothetical protein
VTEQSTELKTEVMRLGVTARMIEETSKGVLNFQDELVKIGVRPAQGSSWHRDVRLFLHGRRRTRREEVCVAELKAPQRDDGEGMAQLPLLLGGARGMNIV